MITTCLDDVCIPRTRIWCTIKASSSNSRRYISSLFQIINRLQLRFPPPRYRPCCKQQYYKNSNKREESRRFITENCGLPVMVLYISISCSLQNKSSQSPIKWYTSHLISNLDPGQQQFQSIKIQPIGTQKYIDMKKPKGIYTVSNPEMEKSKCKHTNMNPERLLPSEARKLEAYRSRTKNAIKRESNLFQFTYTGCMIQQ